MTSSQSKFMSSYCIACSCILLSKVLTNEWSIHDLAGDKLVGEVSRLVVAEACIQALDIEFTEGQIYELNSVKVIVKTYVTQLSANHFESYLC